MVVRYGSRVAIHMHIPSDKDVRSLCSLLAELPFHSLGFSRFHLSFCSLTCALPIFRLILLRWLVSPVACSQRRQQIQAGAHFRRLLLRLR